MSLLVQFEGRFYIMFTSVPQRTYNHFQPVSFTMLWLRICISMSAIKMFAKVTAIFVPIAVLWIWRQFLPLKLEIIFLKEANLL